MAKTAKPASSALVLTTWWQLAFVVVMLASFVAEVALILHLYTSHGYIGRGTWTYQISNWAYPILSAVVGLLFAYPRNRLWLHRVFWVVFLGTLSVTIMNLVLLIENQIRSANHWYYTGNSPSYWLAFGWDWVTMGVCFALYSAGLFWISQKGRR